MTPASRSAQSLGRKVLPSRVMPWMKTSLASLETIRGGVSSVRQHPGWPVAAVHKYCIFYKTWSDAGGAARRIAVMRIPHPSRASSVPKIKPQRLTSLSLFV
ncbi:MAG: hypothetical protein NVS3B2_03810 [Ramlibacter sp.]